MQEIDQALERIEKKQMERLFKAHPLPWRPGILAYILPETRGVELRGFYPIDSNGGVVYEMMFVSDDAILAWFNSAYQRYTKEATE